MLSLNTVVDQVVADLRDRPVLARWAHKNADRVMDLARSALLTYALQYPHIEIPTRFGGKPSLQWHADGLNRIDLTGEYTPETAPVKGYTVPINTVIRLAKNPRRFVVVHIDPFGDLKLAALSGPLKSAQQRGRYYLGSVGPSPLWVVDDDQSVQFTGPEADALWANYADSLKFYYDNIALKPLIAPKQGSWVEPAALLALVRDRKAAKMQAESGE
jgi:hypothetical protein